MDSLEIKTRPIEPSTSFSPNLGGPKADSASIAESIEPKGYSQSKSNKRSKSSIGASLRRLINAALYRHNNNAASIPPPSSKTAIATSPEPSLSLHQTTDQHLIIRPNQTPPPPPTSSGPITKHQTVLQSKRLFFSSRARKANSQQDCDETRRINFRREEHSHSVSQDDRKSITSTRSGNPIASSSKGKRHHVSVEILMPPLSNSQAEDNIDSTKNKPFVIDLQHPFFNPFYDKQAYIKVFEEYQISQYLTYGEIRHPSMKNMTPVVYECPICVLTVTEPVIPPYLPCRDRVCLDCLKEYITREINHSRVNISCPVCAVPIHPLMLKFILQDDNLINKYETFMIRKVIAHEPDARWCPAPDCNYVVIAEGCASCPKLVCGRESCKTSFCYHCKQEWHPDQTCNAALAQRKKKMLTLHNMTDLIEESSSSPTNRRSSKSSQHQTQYQQHTFINPEDIKECPVCQSRIVKMNDGSCNHMSCSICDTQFCWLCMREITDLHYFSPSGCTFWGKKPWSRKKKLLWQLGLLIGAPVCVIVIASMAVPAIVIGLPFWAARKLHKRLESKRISRYRKNAIITCGVLVSFAVAPIISAFALAIGVPVLLGYVYGVVPVGLCCDLCLSKSSSIEDLQYWTPSGYQNGRNVNIRSQDVASIQTGISNKLGDPSIGETSLYMSNISLETNSIGHITQVERDDRENDSNVVLAGSIISQVADDGNSTRALAGSIISKESGYTLIPVEVHKPAYQSGISVSSSVSANNPSSSPETSSVIPTVAVTPVIDSASTVLNC